MSYLNLNYRLIFAASLSAIVCITSPILAHAPEYHEPSEPEEVSTPTETNPTSEPKTNSETTTCTTEATCETDLEPKAEKKSTFSLPTGELVMLLLVSGPWIMVGFKQRWQHHHK